MEQDTRWFNINARGFTRPSNNNATTMTITCTIDLEDHSLFVEAAYIYGKWINADTHAQFEVSNPAHGRTLGRCPECTTSDLQDAVQAAHDAAWAWTSLSGRQRSRILRRAFELMVENKVDMGRIITAENGKSIADAEGEVMMAASYLEWFSEEATRVYGDVVPHSNPDLSLRIHKEPIGVCGLITPWNFPLAMAARKVAAALAAGCTVILKSDGVTPFSSNALAIIMERAGVFPGVFNVLTALKNTPELGLALCKSPKVKKISFTGSTRVGKLLMRQCSGTLKKLSLELGGNAAFIVFDDADLEVAVASALVSKFKVTGQTCVCANRFYVQDGIYERFSKRLVEETRKTRIGDGSSPGVTHGPLTMGTFKVRSQIADATEHGARILLGGSTMPSHGENFHELTVLGDVTDNMLVMKEETFGPIAALARFTTEEEVVRRANDCEVGLASYVMTQDLARSHRVSQRLETGMVAINTPVISDSSSP
jgi:succinate-semialdehyde dehydrogenase/glutarate-semialdehyde dehydrogenase